MPLQPDQKSGSITCVALPIKRPNTQNWFYLFQIKGKKFFGSTGTPKKTLAAKVEAKKREEVFAHQVLGEAKPITLADALDRYKQSREKIASYKNLLTYSNKLLGFKLDPKTGKKIIVGAVGKPDIFLHEITNKHINILVASRKSEQVAHWTIKHEIQTLRSTIQLACELGFQVNSEINWSFKELKTKKGRLRFLTQEEEQWLLKELDPNRHDKGMVPPAERTTEMQKQMQDNYDLVISLLDTGMRYDEMAKLPWSSIDMEAFILDKGNGVQCIQNLNGSVLGWYRPSPSGGRTTDPNGRVIAQGNVLTTLIADLL